MLAVSSVGFALLLLIAGADGPAARAAERIDPAGGSARRSLLSGRRFDARPAHGHRREPRDGRLHPVALRAHGAEAGRAERQSYFQPYNLMTATSARATASTSSIGDGRARGNSPSGRSSIRIDSARAASVSGPVVFAGFGISAPHAPVRRLQRRREGQDRPGARSRAGRARPEQPVRRRRHVGVVDGVAQGARGAGEGRGRRCCSSATCTIIPASANFEAAARNYWPEKPPRILNYTLAAWADRIRIPVAQISPALAAIARRRQPASRSRIWRSRAETRARLHADRAAGRPRRAAHSGRPSHRAGSQRRRAARRERPAAEGRVGARLGALRSQRRRRDADLQRRGRQRIGHGGAASRSRRPTRWPRRRASGRSGACCSPRGTPRSAACSARGRTRSSRCAPLTTIAAVLNMDMIGRNEEIPVGGGKRFNGLEVQTAESNSNALNLMAFSKVPDITAAVEKANARHRARAEEALRQQQLESAAAQRSVAVPAARRAGDGVHHGSAPRLPHAVRPAREDQLRRRWKRSRAWCIR